MSLAIVGSLLVIATFLGFCVCHERIKLIRQLEASVTERHSLDAIRHETPEELIYYFRSWSVYYLFLSAINFVTTAHQYRNAYVDYLDMKRLTFSSSFALLPIAD